MKTIFDYDNVGNREAVVSGTTTHYTTNDLNQYTAVDATPYAYDANGNLTSDGTRTYSYDFENRLLHAAGPTSQAEYEYDSFGRRVSKKVYDSLHSLLSTCCFIYDGDDIVAEYDAFGSLIRKYVNGTGIDEIILMENAVSGDRYFLHYDGLNSVTEITDINGNIIEKYKYSAYGSVSIYDNNEQPLTQSQIGNGYLFRGRRYDFETGNYYYRLRYYNPKIGRFLTPDPIGYTGGINLYRFCLNNPLSFLDPNGLEVRRQWTTEEEKQSLTDVIGEDISTEELVKKYNPTEGTESYKLFNLETDTILGKTDIDWALTLAYYSYETDLDPWVLYYIGKPYWMIRDEQGKQFKAHWSTFRSPEEIHAIKMAQELVNGTKKFEDYFPEIEGAKSQKGEECASKGSNDRSRRQRLKTRRIPGLKAIRRGFSKVGR